MKYKHDYEPKTGTKVIIRDDDNDFVKSVLNDIQWQVLESPPWVSDVFVYRVKHANDFAVGWTANNYTFMAIAYIRKNGLMRPALRYYCNTKEQAMILAQRAACGLVDMASDDWEPITLADLAESDENARIAAFSYYFGQN